MGGAPGWCSTLWSLGVGHRQGWGGCQEAQGAETGGKESSTESMNL